MTFCHNWQRYGLSLVDIWNIERAFEKYSLKTNQLMVYCKQTFVKWTKMLINFPWYKLFRQYERTATAMSLNPEPTLSYLKHFGEYLWKA